MRLHPREKQQSLVVAIDLDVLLAPRPQTRGVDRFDRSDVEHDDRAVAAALGLRWRAAKRPERIAVHRGVDEAVTNEREHCNELIFAQRPAAVIARRRAEVLHERVQLAFPRIVSPTLDCLEPRLRIEPCLEGGAELSAKARRVAPAVDSRHHEARHHEEDAERDEEEERPQHGSKRDQPRYVPPIVRTQNVVERPASDGPSDWNCGAAVAKVEERARLRLRWDSNRRKRGRCGEREWHTRYQEST